jgi:hypothetical protein
MRVVGKIFAAAAAVAVLAAPAAAQRHEFGVDLGIASSKFDTPNAERFLEVGTPVDVRVGMVLGGPLSLESRFSLAYMSSDGASLLSFDPGLNVLFRFGGTPQQGLYVTGGAKIDIARVSNDDDSETVTQLGGNVGVGTRIPMGAAALRIEGFFAMLLEKGDVGDSDYAPALNSIGVRIGLSFWK